MYEYNKHTLATLSRGPENEVRPRKTVDLTTGVVIMYHRVLWALKKMVRVGWLRRSPVQESWGIQTSYQCAVKFCLDSSIDLIFPFLTPQKKGEKKKKHE